MLRHLNERVAVSGQIEPSDLEDLTTAGFQVVVDARPDGEIPDHLHSSAMKEAAAQAGLAFHYIPMTPGAIPSEEDAKTFLSTLSGGKTFAYCGGGPRAIILASFAAAADGQPIDTIIEEAQALGIDLKPVRELLIARGAKDAEPATR